MRKYADIIHATNVYQRYEMFVNAMSIISEVKEIRNCAILFKRLLDENEAAKRFTF